MRGFEVGADPPRRPPSLSLPLLHTSVLAARSVRNPISRSRFPSRRGESSGLRRQAGRPRRRFAFSYWAPFCDRAFLRHSPCESPLVEGEEEEEEAWGVKGLAGRRAGGAAARRGAGRRASICTTSFLMDGMGRGALSSALDG